MDDRKSRERRRVERRNYRYNVLRFNTRLDSKNSLFIAVIRSAVLLYITKSLPAAEATFSITKCCVVAVRQDFMTYIDDFYPWEACNYNVDIDYKSNKTFPSIQRPMSWAKQYCKGTEYSTTSEWLQPLATYISPYIGLLLLCPIGDNAVRWSFTRSPLVNDFIVAVWRSLREYSSILGDPSSAIFGSISEIMTDAEALTKLSTQPVADNWDSDERNWRRWVAALAGAIKFTSEVGWHRHFRESPRWSEQSMRKRSATNDELASSATGGRTAIYGKEDGLEMTLLRRTETEIRSQSCAARLNRAIKIVIVSRAEFINGILLPVIITLAVTAATFYDAYGSVGDKATALALAYGVFYSWILVVGVAGNCFATAVNPSLARQAFSKVVDFGDESSADVALRNRHINNQFWDHWAEHDEPDMARFAVEIGKKWGFWLRFCVGQFLGWCCVAIASGSAAAISWTTPSTGLGCRSFNFILYAIFSFVVAFLHVVCTWLSISSRQHAQEETDSIMRKNKPLRRKVAIIASHMVHLMYWCLTFANALVMVLGTLFHLIGFFRTCWCEKLSWSDDSLIELNSKTEQAVENARQYWLSTAYVAFGLTWLVCLAAISLRQYIGLKLDNWVEISKDLE